MRLLILALTAMVLSGCAGKADPLDVRCYVLGVADMTTDDPHNEDVALLMFYLGRLDGADPSGKWAEEAWKVMTEAELSALEADRGRCVSRMNAATARLREVGARHGAADSSLNLPT